MNEHDDDDGLSQLFSLFYKSRKNLTKPKSSIKKLYEGGTMVPLVFGYLQYFPGYATGHTINKHYIKNIHPVDWDFRAS